MEMLRTSIAKLLAAKIKECDRKLRETKSDGTFMGCMDVAIMSCEVRAEREKLMTRLMEILS